MPEPFSATAPLKSVKGTSTKPGVTFTGDEDTGLYNSAPDELAVSLGGSEKAKFTGTGVNLDGDITLDDGGTYNTTLQMVTPTANRTISFPDATGTVALVAGSSGQFLYNNAGALAGSSTLIIDGDGNITQSGRLINTASGLASGPPVSLTGTWYSGGTSTTTKPQVLIEPSGTTSTAWSTSGTGLGVNAASGFTGRLLDLQLNGTSNFSVNSTGSVSVPLGSNTSPSVYFGTDTNTGIYSPGADQVAISTNGTGRLFVRSDGSVVATTALTVSDVSSNDRLQLIYGTSDGSILGHRIAATGVDLNYITRLGQNGSHIFSTNNAGVTAERLRITADGKLGLGTSSPQYQLHLGGEAVGAVGAQIALNNVGGTPSARIDGYRVGGSFAGELHFYTTQSVGTQARAITIDSSQRVGIGSTAPASVLSIKGTSGFTYLDSGDNTRFSITQATSPNIRFNVATNNYFLNLESVGASQGAILFTTGTSSGTERARIDSSGRLLVGTSTSASIATREAPIQIASTALAPNVLSGLSTSANIYGPSIALAKSRGGGSPAVISGDILGSIIFAGHDGTDLTTAGAYITAQVDDAVSNDDLPTRLVFSTTADGASSPTERMRITSDAYVRLASGTGGIQFNGDTAAANALNDYEEGTWTPAISGESTAGTPTYTYQAGKYVKIGKLVTLSCFVSTSAHTGTGNINVTGLPFAPNGVGYGVAGEVRGHAASSYGGTVIASCFVYNASTTARFMSATNSVVGIGTGVGSIQIMFTYST